MASRLILPALVLFAAGAAHAAAPEPAAGPAAPPATGLLTPHITYGKPLTDREPVAPPSTVAVPVPWDEVARPPVVRIAPPEAPEPQMIGDFSLGFASVPVTHRSVLAIATAGGGAGFVLPANFTPTVKLPMFFTAGLKIADNESPRPLDRVWVDFTLFNNLDRSAQIPGLPPAAAFASFGPPVGTSSLGGAGSTGLAFLGQLAGSPAFQGAYNQYLRDVLRQRNFVLAQPGADKATAATLLTNAAGNNLLTARNLALLAGRSPQQIEAIIGGVFASAGVTSLAVNGLAVRGGPFAGSTSQSVVVAPVSLFREGIGFEKTLLNGNASIGLRAPVLQLQGDGSVGRSDFGDLSLVFKYALINEAHRVLSAGLVMTLPTGPDTFLATGGSPLNPLLFQPFVGGLLNAGRFYVQGFSSVAVPTDLRAATVLFTDLGAGYFLYRAPTTAVLTSITPVVEMHVNTPLGQAGFDGQPIGYPDLVAFTGGVHLTLYNRARVTVGVGGPVTGPHPSDVNVFTQLNFLF